jgi:Pyruvate/2-oxoacid:ferredoxin oxidoreductase gamma subunit
MVMLAIFIKMVTIELEIEKEIKEARVSKKVKAISLAIHESI